MSEPATPRDIADKRRAVARTAAGAGLVTIASLEIGALVWSGVSMGYREGIVRTPSLLFFSLFSCAIIAQASVVWVVVGRDPAANPARRAVLALIVVVGVFVPASVGLTRDASTIIAAIAMLSLSLTAMASTILIALGIGRIYVGLASRRPGSRTFSRSR